jgi:magnesium transporter
MSPSHDRTSPDLRDRILALVEAGDPAALEPLLAELHGSDVADVVESLSEEDRVALLSILPAELASEALVEMEESEGPAELLATFDPEKQAELVHELEIDDAADLVGEMEPEDQDRVLAKLPTEEAGEIRELLEYDEETAGGLMTTALVAVTGDLTAAGALEQVRIQGREVEDFYIVFVVDSEGHLLGTVPLDHLVIADPGDTVESIVEPALASVLPHEDQEAVGKLIAHYNLPSLPVLDDSGRLLGRVTFDDVIDVMEAEQTEDLLRFSGVSEEEELRGDWMDAVRGRLPWLLLHAVTLSIASSVIILFQDVVVTLPVVAFIMPIIAGLGGNAGTQALAVTVRRLATASGPLAPKRTVVGKEVLVALTNGLMVAIAVALIVTFIGATGVEANASAASPLGLGLVVLVAMWGNILVAGSAGAFIPTLLNRLGADPAVASSVFLTTLTDLIGFFLLLGLASAVLL